MPNTHGSFIWYELLTSDPDAAGEFYSKVLGWTVQRANMPNMDYRFFFAGKEGIGGHMRLPDDVPEAAKRPVWLGYVGVDDVDAVVDRVVAAGGSVRSPATDHEGVGRMAMVADPQGVGFYVMRGASDEESNSFSSSKPGHCSWNELATSDPAAGLSFYTGLFGWEAGDSMPMGEMGDYQFINHGGEMIGAVMPNAPDGPGPRWTFYFRVADIDAATAQVSGNGGNVHHGPSEVPGGDFITIASDPQGAMFGLVGARKGAVQ